MMFLVSKIVKDANTGGEGKLVCKCITILFFTSVLAEYPKFTYFREIEFQCLVPEAGRSRLYYIFGKVGR